MDKIKCTKCNSKDIHTFLVLNKKGDKIKNYICVKPGCKKIFKTETITSKFDKSKELLNIKKTVDILDDKLDKKIKLLSSNFNDRMKSYSKQLNKSLIVFNEEIIELIDDKKNNLYYSVSF
jgi:hypothetical protein